MSSPSTTPVTTPTTELRAAEEACHMHTHIPPLSSPYRHLLLVYGTLKRGENNYPGWLADPCHALFLGTARTCERFPFFVNLAPDFPGCSPCVLFHPVSDEEHAAAVAGGPRGTDAWKARTEHVEGELFLVTDAMRAWLDVLEGIEDGTYAVGAVEVDRVQPPPSLQRVAEVCAEDGTRSTRTLYECLSSPFKPLTPAREHGRLVASVYFREKGFPADWASPSPRSSTHLLANFSAQRVLAEYGARFAGGIPAHLRSRRAAHSMQKQLDALPPALQPPMSTLNQTKRLAQALAHQRQVASETPADKASALFSNYHHSAVDGALVQDEVPATGAARALTVSTTQGELSLFDIGTPLLPKPLVLFIIDGIGDSTYPELGNRTPLEVVAGVTPRRVTDVVERGEGPGRVLRLDRFAPASQKEAHGGSFDFLTSNNVAMNPYQNDAINTVAAAGVSGVMDPYLAGRSCGSDTAHLSFFGYDPEVYYRGRGAYETLGTAVDSSDSDAEDEATGSTRLSDPEADAQILEAKGGVARPPFVLDDEDVCFKSNFATFADPEEDGFGDEDAELEARSAALSGPHTAETNGGCSFNTSQSYFMTHRRCDRNFTKEGPVLCRYLNGLRIAKDVHGVPFDYPHVLKIKYATEHRCGVALSGAKTVSVGRAEEEEVIGALSDKITGTDCLKDGLLLKKCVPTITEAEDPAEYARAVYTCRLVEAASAAITQYLKQHAINESRRQHNRRVAETGVGKRKNLANIILFRGAAKKGWVPTFANRHGLHGAMVAPTCIIKGLGVCCGLECKTVCPVCFPSQLKKLQEVVRQRMQALAGAAEAAENSTDLRQLAVHLDNLRAVNASNSALEGATGDYHSDLSVKVAAALHTLRLRCPWPSFHNYQRIAAITYAHSLLTETQQHGESSEGGEVADPFPLPSRLQAHPHYNFVVVHVKGVDDAGHDGNHHERLRLIGESGTALKTLFDALPDGAACAVIADHSTPLAIGDHCCEPVPVSVAVRRRPAGNDPAAPGMASNGPTLREEVQAFHQWWQSEGRPTAHATARDGHNTLLAVDPEVTVNGLRCANVGELCMALLEEKLSDAPCDAVQRYAEVAAAERGALGRFRGDELMNIMKRTQYYYHFM